MAAPDDLTDRIRNEAGALGFDAAAITTAALPAETKTALGAFIEAGRHGEMGWMEGRLEQRADPHALWADAKSIIMLGMNYGPEHDPMDALKETSNGVISVYAQNKDYHDIIKKRLKRLARWLVAARECEVKVFVDTAPVMEKPLAAQAGLGWQGKHTNLVSRAFGSWLFLGAIFTTLELKTDAPEADHCGSCRNCLDICPTDAFPAPYQLDARRCISYLTIEHKGPIPRALRASMGNRIYGCDDCLAVCPWNKFAATAREAGFHARDSLKSPMLTELATLDDEAFRKFFASSPIKRTGRDRFTRNVAIAIGNSGDTRLAPTLRKLLEDENALVRGAAVWAAGELLSDDDLKTLADTIQPAEKDAEVQAEWRAALSR